MAPSELVWQADANGFRSTAPWPASGAAGLELRPHGWSWAVLRELRPGAKPRPVADVDFYADGRPPVVGEQLPSGRERRHVLPGGGAVRLRWEKAAGWKLWVEAGERRVLQATFESPEPQLELRTRSTCVDHFDVCLLPLPGPVGTLQSPPPACAQLQARIDQLYELLTREKKEETQKAESAQHENKALHQRIDSLMEQLETEKQQAEIVQNLQKQLDELAQQKAKEMKKVEDLQQNNETLQQRFALLTQKAQKSEMTQCILQLKEQCDAFLAFSCSDSNDPQAEEGPGATPRLPKSDMYSDTSSRSAKCFLPNTALHGVDGHLLRVEKLKLGDRVRLVDQTEASVVGMYMHQAKKKPHDLVDLTTRQSRSTVSKSHRVAVPAEGSEGTNQIGHVDSEGEAYEAERADQLGVGNMVFVGCKRQKLTKVTSRKEHTTLYEVRLDPDGPLEMLQLPSFGLVTFGSLAARSSAPSAIASMGSVAGSEPADAEMPGSGAEG